jgi:hypothetical protein
MFVDLLSNSLNCIVLLRKCNHASGLLFHCGLHHWHGLLKKISIILFNDFNVFFQYFGYELQLIFGGKRFQMDTDEYILGAIVMYIDIVMIFMHILNILQYFFSD